MALQIFGQRFEGIAAKGGTQIVEGSIEFSTQRHGGNSSGSGMFPVPNDVQDDILKGGIAVMAVRAPTAGTEVDFNVAGACGFGADSHHGTVEIRASFIIFETRMKNSNRMTVQRDELVAQDTLLLPDSLEQLFRRRRSMVFPQGTDWNPASAPDLEIGRKLGHLGSAFERAALQSQAFEKRNCRRARQIRSDD